VPQKFIKGGGVIHGVASRATRHFFKGQGATEYLAVLSVVIVIALVSISLLGDSFTSSQGVRNSQSSVYWQSARPIAITESKADTNGLSLRMKNNGPDPLSVLGITSEGQFYAINPPTKLQPGEEGTIEYADSILNHKGSGGEFGTLIYKNFGFYYATSLEDQRIVHTQSSEKSLEVTCVSQCSSTGDSQTGCGLGCGAGMMCCEAPPQPEGMPPITTYQCVLTVGQGQPYCTDMECQSGYFSCQGACVPIGTACNPCGQDCGIGMVCCQYTMQCMDVRDIGSCVQIGPPHV